MSKSFEEKYPNLTDFVYTQGIIRIGYDEYTSSFVSAYDEGGSIQYEGKDEYNSLEEALEDLEAVLGDYLGKI